MGRPRHAYTKQIRKDVSCTTYEEMKRKSERMADWTAAVNQSPD
jgi:hypothetical protein